MIYLNALGASWNEYGSWSVSIEVLLTLKRQVKLDSLNIPKNETEEMHCGKTCISSLNKTLFVLLVGFTININQNHILLISFGDK